MRLLIYISLMPFYAALSIKAKSRLCDQLYNKLLVFLAMLLLKASLHLLLFLLLLAQVLLLVSLLLLASLVHWRSTYCWCPCIY
jgi:hypothetical protein